MRRREAERLRGHSPARILVSAGAVAALLLVSGCPRDLPQPSLVSVTPDRGLNTAPVEITISGESLLPDLDLMLDGSEPILEAAGGFTAFLGENVLEEVVWVDGQTLSAVVPAGLAPGLYDLIVNASADRSATLEAAFEVYDETGPDPHVTHFWIEPEKMELTVGESRFLRVFTSREDGTVRELGGELLVDFEVEGDHVSVSGFGVVTGESVGRAIVTAVFEDHSAEATIDVVDELLRIEPGRLLMTPGQVAGLRLIYGAGGAEEDVTADAGWGSAIPTTASVSAGEVSAIASGITTITASHGGLSTSVEVRVAASGDGTVVLGAGDPWWVRGPVLELHGVDLPSGSALAGHGAECVGLTLGVGGLSVHTGARVDVSGMPGIPGTKDEPQPIGNRRGGDGGPGGGGGGGGSVGGEGGSGSPPGESTTGDNADAGWGGGPGGGEGGLEEMGVQGAGSAGGGGGFGGAGGGGGWSRGASRTGGAGGPENEGTLAGGGSGGGGGDGGTLNGPQGPGGGGGGGGGCIEVVSIGDVIVSGQVLARGGSGGGAIQSSTGGGGGGGSGGRILLRSDGSVRVEGFISAAGGAGGSAELARQSQSGGGGGGGGGGLVLLEGSRVELEPGSVTTAAGGPGGRVNQDHAVEGEPGEDGVVEIVD